MTADGSARWLLLPISFRQHEGQQGDAEEPPLPNMRLSPDSAVLTTLPEHNVLTKIRAALTLSPEEARPAIWRHAWSPLTIQAIPSVLCYFWIFASCYRGKREDRKFSLNIYTELQHGHSFPPVLKLLPIFPEGICSFSISEILGNSITSHLPAGQKSHADHMKCSAFLWKHVLLMR